MACDPACVGAAETSDQPGGVVWFDFKLISTVRLTTHLEEILKTEKIAAAPEAIRLIARQAAGSVRDALSLLDQAIAYGAAALFFIFGIWLGIEAVAQLV